MILWVDTETRSRTNLKTAGLYRYLEDVELVLLQWAVDDGPVTVHDMAGAFAAPVAFRRAWAEADRIVAHNVEFDAGVLRQRDDPRWFCTQAAARRHGLPGGLDKLCEVLRVPVAKAKLKAGHEAMLLFCRPMKDGTWATRDTHPAQWAVYLDYARLDIEAMRQIYHLLPTWNNDAEHPIWQMDQRINARGFAVDVELASCAVEQLARCKDDLADQTAYATGGAVGAATQRDKLLAYLLAEHGVDLPDLTAATLERRLADPDLPDGVRGLLALRQGSSKTSTGKYAALLRTVSNDARLRGTMAYCGAGRTGRWAGRVFQPHNLPRPTLGGAAIARGIAAIKADCVDLVCEAGLPEVASNAVRGCVISPPGKTLLVADLANIEGRVVAWLAGEQWKLDAFRAYDEGTGPDLYKLAYARAFDIPTEDVTKPQRQIGKVMELMLGYEGGVGAFVTGGAGYGIDLDEMAAAARDSIPEDVWLEAAHLYEFMARNKRNTHGLVPMTWQACDSLKRLWRRKHPRIVRFWETTLGACLNAVRSPDTLFYCNPSGTVTADRKGNWLRVRLPSGRYLCYPGARVDDDKLSYLGQNPYTRQWGRIGTYGGKLVENITQAVARDCLAFGALDAEDHGLDPVLHVHDEIICESADGTVDDLVACMVRARSWTDGLPLAAAGFETNRYEKQ